MNAPKNYFKKQNLENGYSKKKYIYTSEHLKNKILNSNFYDSLQHNEVHWAYACVVDAFDDLIRIVDIVDMQVVVLRIVVVHLLYWSQNCEVFEVVY